MYLSKLEILGFKSFAQKTVIHFNRGITAIVGPNGCGKTNIVDALRWCIGEQKSSVLRSDKMENVIFNGTSSRKPLGMSEVSLTIENDKGVLPVDYTEVIITRRIFRSGESEYLMNKNIARLKDITSLFMDTGMGANAYSVIELKMVESILSNKADERRTMFEEAAGVNKYKIRRKLTLKKLEDVKADLARANDLISEIEKKVISLERQAKRAQKYQELADRLQEIDLKSAAFDLYLMINEQGVWQQQHFDATIQKNEVEISLSRLDEVYAGIREKTYITENELKEIRKKIGAQTELIYKNERTVSVAQESRRSLQNNITRFEAELAEFAAQIEDAEAQLDELHLDHDDKIIEEEKALEEKNLLNGVLEEKRGKLAEAREKIKIFSQSVLTKVQGSAERKNELSNLEKSRARIQKEIERVTNRLELLNQNETKNRTFVGEVSADLEETSTNLSNAERVFNETTERKESLEKELDGLREKEFEIKSSLNDLKTRIDFLNDLINNLEGFSLASKKLMESDGWFGGEKKLVSDFGEPLEEFRFAIEAALKLNFNSFIVSSVEEVKAAIELLLNSNSGKASFVLSRNEDGKNSSFMQKMERFAKKRVRLKMEQEPGFVNFAGKLLNVPGEYVDFYESLLSNVVVVKDLDTSIRLSGSYSGYKFITLDGDTIGDNGSIEAGSRLKDEDTLFGKKTQLEQLKNGIKPLEEQLATWKQKIYNTEYDLHLIDLKDMGDVIRIYQNDLMQLEKQMAQLEFEIKKGNEERETLSKELSHLESQAAQLDIDIARLTSEIEEDDRHQAETSARQREFDVAAQEVEKEFSVASAEYNKKGLELERIKGETKNILNSIERVKQSIIMLKNSVEKRGKDIETAAGEIEILTGTIEDSEFDLEEQKQERENLRVKEREIEAVYLKEREELDNLEKEKTELRKNRDKISEALHKSDLKFNEYTINIRNLKRRVNEKYEIEIEPVEPPEDQIASLEGWRVEVRELEHQLHQIGPVNLLAFEEYDEEKKRFDFFAGQRSDLIQSEKDLMKTIDEINTTAQNLFNETFEAIRENFQKIFRSLFRQEDEADLRLEEGVDPLEARIEIIAKPRGKRPTSIELLSGGEKTLTAIALLFAIYLVKPSPFCILDEIDAPLDDANIDRFTKIVREFSENTQFIVVTHNKRTMEAADTMYGVTMQEEGVSKLVSVRFNEDFNIVA